ncbi:MAG: glutamyl-tRNA reductase [bacterium]
MSLLTIGLNHTTAPVEIRERVVLPTEQASEILESLLGLEGVKEAAVVSTCNRTEVTLWAESPDAGDKTIDWVASRHGFDAESLKPYLYQHKDNDAIRHTLRVACGLDSLVLGEPQILGQLKQAYQAALDNQSLGRHLGRLFQHTFSTAKQVRTETAIGASAVSVAFAAVSLAKQIFGELGPLTALLIGAGETIELAARHLERQGIGHIIIANRTVERAQKLAEEFGAEAIALPEIPEHLPRADVVISSTASPLPILGKGTVERALKKRKHRPVFMVDIAVPRDIEHEVSELEDIYLYTVDDLHDVIEENLKSRQQAAEQAEELVEAQVDTFNSWLKSQEAIHNIKHFREQAYTVRDDVRQSCQKLLEQGKPAEEVLDFLAHTLTNKLIHAPTVCMNAAAKEGNVKMLQAAHRLLGFPGCEGLQDDQKKD